MSFFYAGFDFWDRRDSDWWNYVLSVLFFILGVVLLFWFFKKLNNQSRGKIFILYLVDKGVDINKKFIPFSYYTKRDGIVMFKLDGDYLLLKTQGAALIDVADDLSEADLRFKIDPKYLANKEHLLTHLNNLIKEDL